MHDAYVGIDWASTAHAVCALDETGRRRTRFAVDHTEEGLGDLVRRLGSLGERSRIPVAIERPDGVVVDRLLEAGHPVVPVKPAAIKAYRSGETPSGAKSDPGDAEVIAEYLRLRVDRLRVLAPFSEHTRALRHTTRTRTRLVRRRVRATNQLEATLGLIWPGAMAAFPDLTTQIAGRFLHRYPSPEAATHLGPKRMAGFLTRAGYSGGWQRSPETILALLRSAPAGAATGSLSEACEAVVLAQVEALEALAGAIRSLERAIDAQLDEHPDAETFLSLPHSGKVNAAQMLAEWGDCREAYETSDAVAALAGMSPVTRASGKHEVVLFRWACNKWLRSAVATFADNSRHGSPWAADVYRRAIDRGCEHPHAVRILGRAWTRVIWRCWVDRRPYDPELHGAARTLVAA